MKDPKAFYELCAKWIKLPPFGLLFKYQGKEHTIIGIVRAGNKIRAKCSDEKVYLFEAKNFQSKYKIEIIK